MKNTDVNDPASGWLPWKDTLVYDPVGGPWFEPHPNPHPLSYTGGNLSVPAENGQVTGIHNNG